MNVTDRPLEPGKLLYANNITGEVSLTGNEPAGWQLYPVEKSNISYDVPKALRLAAASSPDFSAVPIVGNRVYVKKWRILRPNGSVVQDTSVENRLQQIPINLKGQPEGLYVLEISLDKQVLPRYEFISSDALEWRKPFALYEYFAFPEGQGETLKFDLIYTARFNTHDAIWRYFLVNSSGVKLNDAAIEETTVNGVIASFSGPEEAEIPDGRPALVFVSEQPIPLKEHPSGEVVLAAESLGGAYPLPYAGSNPIRRESTSSSVMEGPDNSKRNCSLFEYLRVYLNGNNFSKQNILA